MYYGALKTSSMKTSQTEKPIEDLVSLFKSRMLIANPEYQRGVVWTEAQQKRLIDSLFRGYKLPLIYLNEKREEIAGYTNEGLEIIDGQQRLTAICRYVEGAFRLFVPVTDNDKAKFPRFLPLGRASIFTNCCRRYRIACVRQHFRWL